MSKNSITGNIQQAADIADTRLSYVNHGLQLLRLKTDGLEGIALDALIEALQEAKGKTDFLTKGLKDKWEVFPKETQEKNKESV